MEGKFLFLIGLDLLGRKKGGCEKDKKILSSIDLESKERGSKSKKEGLEEEGLNHKDFL